MMRFALSLPVRGPVTVLQSAAMDENETSPPFDGQVPDLDESETILHSVLQQIKDELSSPLPVIEGITPLEELGEILFECLHELIRCIDIQPAAIEERNIQLKKIEAGNTVLDLAGELVTWCEYHEQTAVADEVNRAIIGLSVWMSRQGISLYELATIVNAITPLANRCRQPLALKRLHYAIQEIINATASIIKNDMENTDPQRPWRMLNINHGIIATRTHDSSIIREVYEQLSRNFPFDAADFFAEGMQQMEIIGYPDHVRELVRYYYEKTNKPVLH